MRVDLSLPPDESRLYSDFAGAITSTLDLNLALARALPILQRLVSADSSALGVSKPGSLDDYEWTTSDLPYEFLAGYSEMIPHDFVRKSVIAKPNMVLRDSDMITQRELERNFVYVRSKECGANLRHVMATMLHVDADWTSGISLYRSRAVPFSEREQRLFQLVTPTIANVVTNCRTMAASTGTVLGLEAALEAARLAVIVVRATGREVARTARATMLLERWFHESRSTVLPSAIVEHFAAHVQRGQVPPRIVVDGEVTRLKIHFICQDPNYWGVVLSEERYWPNVPTTLKEKLTTREIDVCEQVLQGKSNVQVASDLGCAEKTVKKHLQNIFNKLGLDGRQSIFTIALDAGPLDEAEPRGIDRASEGLARRQ